MAAELALTDKATGETKATLQTQFVSDILHTTFILTYRGRHKVEKLYVVAKDKSTAINDSQKYCTKRSLKWMNISPMFADLHKEPKPDAEE